MNAARPLRCNADGIDPATIRIVLEGSKNVKWLLSFFLPGGILLVAAVVLVRTNVLAAWFPEIGVIYPCVVLAGSVLLGWRFNRSRLIFAVLALAIADRALFHFTRGQAASTAQGKLIYDATVILLPLNLAILSLLKERGIFTWRGVWRMSLILAQPLAIGIICYESLFIVNDYIDYRIVTQTFLQRFLPPQPPQTVLAAAAISFLLVCAGLLRKGESMRNGFFWSLLAAGFALLARKQGAVCTFYFATAGLILAISVIEASYAMAFRDELTGLPARRSLNEFLLRLGSRYTVAMLDIDHFKKFNDTYGHDVGDQVLRMVASKISAVSGGGRAFRYGGEEFTVIFPGKSADEAFPHLDFLRAVIEKTGFSVRGKNRPKKKPDKPRAGEESARTTAVTISIGIAERNGEYGNPQEVIKAADKALYRAKKAGRNRVST